MTIADKTKTPNSVKTRYKATLVKRVRLEAVTEVMASTEEEALDLAAELAKKVPYEEVGDVVLCVESVEPVIEMTQEILEGKLALLGDMDDETTKKIVCSLIGHSRIQMLCSGLVYCGRCGQEHGDILAGVHDIDEFVWIGHKCDTCVENYESCTWKDTFMAPDPFGEEE